MFNNKKLLFFMIFTVYLIYFLIVFMKSFNLPEEVGYAILFSIILFFQSIGEFFYFWIKNNKPRLQDWFRIIIFLEIVLNLYSIVNSSHTEYIELINSIIINYRYIFLSLLNIFIIYVILDFIYMIFNIIYKDNSYINNIKKYKVGAKKIALSFYAFSVILKFYLLINGMYGFGEIKLSGINSLIYNLSNILNFLGLISVLYIIYIERYNNILFKKIFFIFFVLDIFIGLLSGMKEFMLTPILYFLIIYLLSGNKIPFKIIIIMFFLGIIIYPLNNIYRNIISNPLYSKLSKVEKFQLAITLIKNKNIDILFSKSISSYGNRVSFFPIYLYSIQNEQNWNQYKYMTRYIYLPISFLPRFIIKNKPSAINGNILYHKITQNNLRNVSITPTAIGWSYLEGGIFFVIVIFFILGIVIELIDRSNKQNLFNLFLFIFLLHKLLKPEWDPYFLLTSLLQIIIISFIYLKIIKFKRIYNET